MLPRVLLGMRVHGDSCAAFNLQHCDIFRHHSTSNTSERLQGVKAASLRTAKQDYHLLLHYTQAVYTQCEQENCHGSSKQMMMTDCPLLSAYNNKSIHLFSVFAQYNKIKQETNTNSSLITGLNKMIFHTADF